MKRNWKTFPRLKRWEWIVVGVALANFLAFLIVSLWLGGSAANGTIDGDRYYLGDHGRFTEVSKQVYVLSQIHLRLMLLTHLAAVAVLIMAKLRELDQDNAEG